MVRASVILAAWLLDGIVGDPHSFPHPVRWMGNLITMLEKWLRPRFPAQEKGERRGGECMVLAVLGICFLCTVLILYTSRMLSFWLEWAVSVVICCYMLARRSLQVESTRVETALEQGSVEEARRAVSMIVGRDTESLDETGIARAAVETVAENASDGIIAPLVYMALFGPLGGVLYKAVNTMDSMVGYRNERYVYWGRTAAKLDDAVNFLPARLSGVLMCLAAPLVGLDGAGAWRCFRRDRLKHKSPNSAHTEAACAGALGVELGGPSRYFGQWVEKPALGDPLRAVEPGDICRANALMSAAGTLALVLCCAGNILMQRLWIW